MAWLAPAAASTAVPRTAPAIEPLLPPPNIPLPSIRPAPEFCTAPRSPPRPELRFFRAGGSFSQIGSSVEAPLWAAASSGAARAAADGAPKTQQPMIRLTNEMRYGGRERFGMCDLSSLLARPQREPDLESIRGPAGSHKASEASGARQVSRGTINRRSAQIPAPMRGKA